MSKPLTVLILEDVSTDAELILLELRRNGFVPSWKLVDNEKDFIANLKPELDLILSDYNLPQFTGLLAFKLLRESGFDIPFILVSGAIGEELAVECMRAGVDDYVFKDRLGRLGIAVINVLKNKKMRLAKRKSDEALRASEEKYRSLFNMMQAGSAVHEIICDDAGKPINYRYLEINPAYEKITGRRAPDVVGKTVLEVYPNLEPCWIENCGKVALTGEPILYQNYVRDLDKYFDVAVYSTQKYQFVTIFFDVTERKQYTKKLQEERDRAQKYLDIAEVSILALDQNGKITLINNKGAGVLGYPVDELIGKDWFETCLPPEDQKEAKLVFKNFMAGSQGLGRHFEQTILTRTGEKRIIDWHSTPITNTGNQRIGSLSSGEDITEKKLAEQQLIEKTNFLSALYKAGKQLSQTLDLDTIYKNLHRTISETIVCDGLVISSFNPQTKLIRCVRMWNGGQPIDVSKLPPITLEPSGKGLQSCVIRSGKAHYFADLQAALRSSRNYYYVNEEGIKHHNETPEDEQIPRSALMIPLILENQVTGVVQVLSYCKNDFSEDDLQFLESFSPQVAAAMANAALYEQTMLTKEKLQKTVEGTIHTLALVVEARDPYTAGHQRHVSDLATAIAAKMGLSESQIEGIGMAGIIHDIGKIQVPTQILNKPGKLTQIEFSLIKIHPQVGYDLLKDNEFPWPIAQMVLQHHEHLDGSGYPNGLKGDEIMLEARILSVADVVEAVSSHRPYRPALGIDKALEIIQEGSGTLFDPDVVDACLISFEHGYRMDQS